MTGRHRFPTHDEMLALEQAARRARAHEFARLLRAAARRLKALIARGAAALARNKARRADAPARHGV
jgi:hypothetical protein